MPKGNFNKDKRNKLKLERSMSMRERDKIKDPKRVIEIAKEQEKRRSRTLTAADIERERQEKLNAPVKGVTVKVRPLVKQPGATQETNTQAIKSAGSTQTYAERKHQANKLQQYREQLSVLVDLANERVADLASKPVTSRALDAAIASRPESRNPSDDLFKANLRSEKQIKRELSRVMTFLNDPTSLAEGAENFSENLSAMGLFGGQYRANGGPGYNTDEVTQEVGETVFGIYHRVLEAEGGWERVMGYLKANSGGLVEYGSENLINAIYDMVVQMGTDEETQRKIIDRASTMIDNMVESYQTMAVRQRAGVDYGLIGYDDTAEDRRHHWQWSMQRKGLL